MPLFTVSKLLSTDLTSKSQDLSTKARHVLEVREEVFAHWEARVRQGIAGAQGVAHPVLLDTLPMFYGNIVEALSPGFARDNAVGGNTAAAGHGGERARTTEYQVVEVVHEYHLLRDSLLAVCAHHAIVFSSPELDIITRSFDQAIVDSVNEFTTIQSAFRERIAATLTHDMRTPLSVIVGTAHLLTRVDKAHIAPLAKKIIDNGRRLEAMFNEQLDALERTPAGTDRLKVTQWDALALAQLVCEQFNDLTAHSCRVSGEAVSGWWDRDLLQRALENLIGNALKYGASDTVVSINVAQAHGRVIISVHNCGNPIAKEQRAEIFRYLNRSGADDQPGWGLGLPFVQDVATRHSGTVVLDSSQAAGTTFSIDIPCDRRTLSTDP
ncbi:MAG: histidine kinase [Polaromonas sp.]|jgi:signal transduction histidine kinase|nr:histidine kinase [Polaromonas sp.]